MGFFPDNKFAGPVYLQPNAWMCHNDQSDVPVTFEARKTSDVSQSCAVAEPGIYGWVCQMYKISKQICNMIDDKL